MWIRPKSFDKSRDKLVRITPNKILSMRSKPNEFMYSRGNIKTYGQLQRSTSNQLINPEYKNGKFWRARVTFKGKKLARFKRIKSSQEHGGTQYINKLATAIKSKGKKVPMLVVYNSELKMGKVYQGRHRALATKKLGNTMPIIIRSPKKR